VVSLIHDPLGFIAPFILRAQLILQDLSKKKLRWDDKIPNEELERWKAWLEVLPKLEEFSIDQCFKLPGFERVFCANSITSLTLPNWLMVQSHISVLSAQLATYIFPFP